MKITLFLTLILITCTSQAVKFHSYLNEKGETVFSNVPQNCIKNSTLTCLKYHPVFTSAPEAKIKSRNIAHQPRQKPNASANASSDRTNVNGLFGKQGSGLQLDLLERVVEMNQFLNEYYPAKPDPSDASRVREQQDTIMHVLQVIRNTVSSDEKPSIERAMDILRSNLVD
jgi:hypothetical protein